MSAPERRPLGSGWPAAFPVAQFPNPPLLVALAASVAGRFTDGTAHRYTSAIFYTGIAIWAYLELTDGVNWFRRLLGAAGLLYVVVRVAHGLDS